MMAGGTETEDSCLITGVQRRQQTHILEIYSSGFPLKLMFSPSFVLSPAAPGCAGKFRVAVRESS